MTMLGSKPTSEPASPTTSEEQPSAETADDLPF